MAAVAAPLTAYRMPTTFYRNADGLPQEQVRVVVQDPLGHILVGTQGGVGIFDGRSFARISVRDGLPSADVSALEVDPRGRIWVGTNLGLAWVEKGVVHPVGLAPGMDPYILRIQAAGGLLYVLTRQGLYSYDGQRFSCVFSGAALAFWAQEEGGLCILTQQYLHIRRGAAQTAHPVPAAATPAILKRLRDGSLLAGTSVGLFRWKDGEWTTLLSGLSVTDFLEDRHGQLWVATGNGGIRHLEGGRWETYTRFGGSTIIQIHSVFEDREGNLWFGTISGLGKVSYRQMTIYDSEDGLPSVMTSCFLEDAGGILWVGYLGGLARYDRAGRRFIVEPWPGLKDVTVRTMGYDVAGRLWLGTADHGLFVREAGGVRRLSEVEGKPVDRVYQIVADRAGGLWICTRDGVLHWDGVRFRRYDKADGLPAATVYGGAISPQGRFYAGTQKGVALFEGTRFVVPDPLRALTAEINCLYFDASGKMWIGTHGFGLWTLDGDVLLGFTGAHSLPDDFVWGIVQDSRGDMWVATNSGIHVRHGEFWLTKNSHIGLPGDEIFIHCAFRDSQGNLWFALPYGTLCIHGERDVPNPVEPGLVLSRLGTPKGEYPGTALPFTLSAGERTLQFDFSGLSFQDESQVRFQYYLEPLEKEWPRPTFRASARYVGLRPGRYAFVLRACNNSLVWNSRPLRYVFEIRPYIYETWWFKFGLGALALLVVGAAFALRLRVVTHAKQNLERVVSQRTEELHLKMEIIESLSQVDVLTGLKNRRYFIQRFEEIVAYSRRYREPFCIVIIDIDNFKDVNDTHGHLASDQVLVDFARELDRSFRETDVLARYGGDEFIVLMHRADPDGVRARVEHFLETLRQETFLEEGSPIHLTFSAGIAYVWPKAAASISFDTVVGVADHFMYEAKKAGKNCIFFKEIGIPDIDPPPSSGSEDGTA